MSAVTVPPTPWLRQTGRPAAGLSVSETRVCKRHGPTEYQRYRAGKGRHRWRCKRCVGEAVTRRHQKVKRLLVEQAGGCCAVCGYSRCIVNLQFHHVDPSAKSFRMSMCAGKALATYEAEARKCVLVCANCHGEIEMGLIPSPPAGARFSPANRNHDPSAGSAAAT